MCSSLYRCIVIISIPRPSALGALALTDISILSTSSSNTAYLCRHGTECAPPQSGPGHRLHHERFRTRSAKTATRNRVIQVDVSHTGDGVDGARPSVSGRYLHTVYLGPSSVRTTHGQDGMKYTLKLYYIARGNSFLWYHT